MRSLSFVLILFLYSLRGFGQGYITLQDKPFVYDHTLDSVLWKQLENAPSFSALTQKEKFFFYWVNRFRSSPQNFYSSVVKEFIRQFPEANSKEYRDLEKDVLIAKPLPMLYPEKGLLTMSKEHGLDLSKRGGVISHKSAKGKDFVQRIKEAGPYRCGAENIFVGTYDPLEALIALLIDYGVADKGHRVNLLDPKFIITGVSFVPISSKKAVLVQVFSCAL